MSRRPLARRLSTAAAIVGLLATAAPARAQPPAGAAPWPVRTREHVDLWLHGMALLLRDTAQVPTFRAHYADSMRARRARAGVTTALDAQAERLRARLGANPPLALDAQFVPLAFPSWDALKRAADALAMTGGAPRRIADRELAAAVAELAATFRTAADREWLRTFVAALAEERDRFYHAHWMTAQRDRTPTLAAADSVWRATRPRLERFLAMTQQRDGELLLSLPLGGEGRTTSRGKRRNLVAVGFPDAPAAAAEATFALAHEVVGATAASAVADHVTPTEQRAGVAARHVAAAQVRGGLVLLERTAPALAPGYARWYLALAGAPAPASDAEAAEALSRAFPLPPAIADALRALIDLAIEGI